MMYIDDVRMILNYNLDEREKLRVVTDEFVSIFWNALMKEMRKSIDLFSPETPSFAMSTYYEWFDGEISEVLAKSNNSLADILYKELIKNIGG
ncbi:MAG: hypothetical protein KBI34_06915 [Dictyoglomi bacterium]|nr:hypothetical protein [Dictyoglomota bacterium]HRU33080.1 hypothetical protein [bacterium]